MSLEAATQSKILIWLNLQAGCYAVKFTSPSSRGHPDVLACYYGCMILFEAKQEGEEPDKMQLYRHESWRRAGASVYVVTCVDEVRSALRSFEHDNFDNRRK